MGIFDGILILSDLDGTLLNSSAEISQRNIDTVKYFMDNGGKFSFATGRNYTSMSYFLTAYLPMLLLLHQMALLSMTLT